MSELQVQLHLRGQAIERRAFPALPRKGDIIDFDEVLGVVDGVVFRPEGIAVYLLVYGNVLTAELRQQWENWGDAPAKVPAEPERQGGLFQ
jgi:hypothetical protein